MKAYKVSAQKSIIEIRARFTANRSSEIDQVNNEILALYRPCLQADQSQAVESYLKSISTAPARSIANKFISTD